MQFDLREVLGKKINNPHIQVIKVVCMSGSLFQCSAYEMIERLLVPFLPTLGICYEESTTIFTHKAEFITFMWSKIETSPI